MDVPPYFRYYKVDIDMNNIRLDKENLRLSKNTKSVDALSIIRRFYDSEFLDQCINMLNNKKYEFMMRLKDQAKAKPPWDHSIHY